jgi:hypothetical protein
MALITSPGFVRHSLSARKIKSTSFRKLSNQFLRTSIIDVTELGRGQGFNDTTVLKYVTRERMVISFYKILIKMQTHELAIMSLVDSF